MRLRYEPPNHPRAQEYNPKPWIATTDNGAYDGRGVSPLDAVTELAERLERAMLKSLEGK